MDFLQITQRLENAIYVDSVGGRSEISKLERDSPDRLRAQQPYFGKILGFKFSATRLVGHKYFHLPGFLFPTIEGNINSLNHGYEILLDFKIRNITLVLMLTCLGGLLATIAPALDNIVGGSTNYQYLTIVKIFLLMYVVAIVHFYIDAWRAQQFFRTLFVKKFALSPIAERDAAQPLAWNSDWQFQDAGNGKSSIDLLRQNLPSFPHKNR